MRSIKIHLFCRWIWDKDVELVERSHLFHPVTLQYRVVDPLETDFDCPFGSQEPACAIFYLFDRFHCGKLSSFAPHHLVVGSFSLYLPRFEVFFYASCCIRATLAWLFYGKLTSSLRCVIH